MYSSGRTIYVSGEPAGSVFRVKEGGNNSAETSLPSIRLKSETSQKKNKWRVVL
jgi:hypothetical protein